MGVRSSLSVDDQAGECAALTAGNLGEPTFPLRAPQILRVRTSTYLRRAGMQQLPPKATFTLGTQQAVNLSET
ncbi:hypothetical protein [Pseudonocardia sp. N23]|uniref:hypothetical protein n=1 Tax=Pseudonocardia sp. N23 TaxID=1987376 RepID=UPI000BFE1012|nr:hypothetical protein [Pseudonocardia sp. N23]GAY11334.1 hypothetical protein TOK_5843 [Pseudonocardia sp. N23]